MRQQQALDQIGEIHAHLARTEVYRGYRAIPAGLTGVTAILGAIFQPHIGSIAAEGVAGDIAERTFVMWWGALAVVNILLAGSAIAWNFLSHASDRDRSRTQHVVGLFLPSLFVGLVITFAFLVHSPALIPILPGLWALIFSLGLFASRPLLPHAIGWIGIFYILCGARLLTLAPSGASLHPWAMGLTFGAGQIMTAGVLYWNLERKPSTDDRI